MSRPPELEALHDRMINVYEDKYNGLLKAVRDIYYSAVWHSDRLTTEHERELWEKLRDAAEFPPGASPKPWRQDKHG